MSKRAPANWDRAQRMEDRLIEKIGESPLSMIYSVGVQSKEDFCRRCGSTKRSCSCRRLYVR